MAAGNSVQGPMQAFFWTTPTDCTVLHVIVVGEGTSLSLYFRTREESSRFVMPLHEGVQSVCTQGKEYKLTAWFQTSTAVHSFSWLHHRYPQGHYVLRFIYRRGCDNELPPLATYAWTVLHANLLEQLVPTTIENPLGPPRHTIFYTEDRIFEDKVVTCNPRTCAYNKHVRSMLRFVT